MTVETLPAPSSHKSAASVQDAAPVDVAVRRACAEFAKAESIAKAAKQFDVPPQQVREYIAAYERGEYENGWAKTRSSLWGALSSTLSKLNPFKKTGTSDALLEDEVAEESAKAEEKTKSKKSAARKKAPAAREPAAVLEEKQEDPAPPQAPQAEVPAPAPAKAPAAAAAGGDKAKGKGKGGEKKSKELQAPARPAPPLEAKAPQQEVAAKAAPVGGVITAADFEPEERPQQQGEEEWRAVEKGRRHKHKEEAPAPQPAEVPVRRAATKTLPPPRSQCSSHAVGGQGAEQEGRREAKREAQQTAAGKAAVLEVVMADGTVHKTSIPRPDRDRDASRAAKGPAAKPAQQEAKPAPKPKAALTRPPAATTAAPGQQPATLTKFEAKTEGPVAPIDTEATEKAPRPVSISPSGETWDASQYDQMVASLLDDPALPADASRPDANAEANTEADQIWPTLATAASAPLTTETHPVAKAPVAPVPKDSADGRRKRGTRLEMNITYAPSGGAHTAGKQAPHHERSVSRAHGPAATTSRGRSEKEKTPPKEQAAEAKDQKASVPASASQLRAALEAAVRAKQKAERKLRDIAALEESEAAGGLVLAANQKAKLAKKAAFEEELKKAEEDRVRLQSELEDAVAREQEEARAAAERAAQQQAEREARRLQQLQQERAAFEQPKSPVTILQCPRFPRDPRPPRQRGPPQQFDSWRSHGPQQRPHPPRDHMPFSAFGPGLGAVHQDGRPFRQPPPPHGPRGDAARCDGAPRTAAGPAGGAPPAAADHLPLPRGPRAAGGGRLPRTDGRARRAAGGGGL